MMTTKSAASISYDSCNCDDVEHDGVELSETVCSVEFSNDESVSPNYDNTCSSSTTPSRASSAAQFSTLQRTLRYDEGKLRCRHVHTKLYSVFSSKYIYVSKKI